MKTTKRWNWTIEFRTADNRLTSTLVGDNGFKILSCDGMANSPIGMHRRLIESAPDLLDALKIILRDVIVEDLDPETALEFRNAIAIIDRIYRPNPALDSLSHPKIPDN